MENNMKEIQTFQKGAIIFKQGEYASCMYDVVKGYVGIYVDYGTENEKQLTVLDENGYFGEMGMLEGYPRSATAVAMEDGTEVEVITSENFSRFFQENPETVMLIIKHMSQRIRGLTRDHLDACRAVVEATEAERTGAEKSSWFKEHVGKFIADFKASVYGSNG